MDDSPLSRLPAENRNDIYELALDYDGEYGCLLEPTRTPRKSSSTLNSDFGHKHPLALTQICKAIRYETRLMFFAMNPFAINFFNARGCRNLEDVTRGFTQFTQAIGADNAKALREVTIQVPQTFIMDCHNDVGSLQFLDTFALWAKQDATEAVLKVNSLTRFNWPLPLDLEHLCFNGKNARCLERYIKNYKFGLREGDCSTFQEQTVHKRSRQPEDVDYLPSYGSDYDEDEVRITLLAEGSEDEEDTNEDATSDPGDVAI